MSHKLRLDDLLVARELAPNKSQARALIMAGKILVNGKKVDKAGHACKIDAELELCAAPSAYVSRGGEKLAGALKKFDTLALKGRVAIDIGASTGGFTDCLLQHGVAKVYAIDVGYGQLAWKLRQDPRVHNIERCNFRYLAAGSIDEDFDLVVADLSFISLEKILDPLRAHLHKNTDCVVLIKPQFEVGRNALGSGGVVRDPALRLEAIENVIAAAKVLGYEFMDGVDSSLPGPKGNVEYLAWLRYEVSKSEKPLL
ncbi:MAG: TlyA family RNA methyltransferase [Bradymonadales bacterium]|jgi:23S rRNA (cytidine1920-2'-O)/16S rRNA (cytidine1409-2'-O)-methyltransferase